MMNFTYLAYLGNRMVMKKAEPLTDADIATISRIYDAKMVQDPWGVNECRIYNFEPRHAAGKPPENRDIH